MALSIPYTFVAGTAAVAAEVNSNFLAIASWANNANIGTDSLGILQARTVSLPSAPTNAILYLNQTSSNPALYILNAGTDCSLEIVQSSQLATDKGVIKITDNFTQTISGANEFVMNLAANSTIPALLIKHGATETFKVTKDYLRLETLLKPPVRTTSQRNAISSPEEGSVIYNSTTEDINIKRANEWAPIGCPVGSLIMYAGPTAPEGWLLCIGSAVPNGSGTIQGITSDFSKLYAVIGANLPDLRGRIPLGKDNMGGSSANRVTNVQADSLLGTEGSETIAETSLPMHTHIYYDAYWSEGSGYSGNHLSEPYVTKRDHPNNYGATGTEGANPGDPNRSHGIFQKTEPSTSSTNNGWNSVVASNLAGNAHMPPYQTFNYIIKY